MRAAVERGKRTGGLGAAVLLVVAGALLVAASWQRWADVCGWGESGSTACLERQDHRFDVVVPGAPWEPVGAAAQLAGGSLLVLAAALVLLPWALVGRRPGLVTAAATLAGALGTAAVGVATLRSGLTGDLVDPVGGGVAGAAWVLLPPAVAVRLAVSARGPRLAAAVLLVLAAPLVAAFSYAVGPYDAQPWWEAVSGVLLVGAGLCLLTADVARRSRGGRGRVRSRELDHAV
ncbi:hypothetical protein ABKW28_20320 [Nocardioides sp. 31GB23]|uniref:hypothetical protein n=1 Tax=Nocardioides sp. 31GB23 TaxID=3156065 RepID=UPI0032AF742D